VGGTGYSFQPTRNLPGLRVARTPDDEMSSGCPTRRVYVWGDFGFTFPLSKFVHSTGSIATGPSYVPASLLLSPDHHPKIPQIISRRAGLDRIFEAGKEFVGVTPPEIVRLFPAYRSRSSRFRGRHRFLYRPRHSEPRHLP